MKKHDTDMLGAAITAIVKSNIFKELMAASSILNLAFEEHGVSHEELGTLMKYKRLEESLNVESRSIYITSDRKKNLEGLSVLWRDKFLTKLNELQ